MGSAGREWGGYISASEAPRETRGQRAVHTAHDFEERSLDREIEAAREALNAREEAKRAAIRIEHKRKELADLQRRLAEGA